MNPSPWPSQSPDRPPSQSPNPLPIPSSSQSQNPSQNLSSNRSIGRWLPQPLLHLFHPAPDSLVALTSFDGRRPGALWFPAVNLIWLAWMVAAPWLIDASPSVFVGTFASIVLFLALYQRAWFDRRARLVGYTLAIAVLGLAIIPVNTSWSYIIYAGSLIPFCVRGWRAAAWLALLLVVFYVVAIGSGLFTPVLTLGCIFTTSIVTLLSGVHRFNIDRDVELRLSQEEVRRLAVTAERERIGRDLHDLLGHTLSLVAIKSELARRLIDRDPAAAARELGEIERVARLALTEVREAVTGIRATVLVGELASARLMLETADIAFVVEGSAAGLDADAEAALAMGLREAVTNVQRHARATRVQVRLATVDGRVRLDVRDDGCGLRGAAGGVVHGHAHERGNGLAGMEERLVALGGTLEVVSEPGRGTEVRMQVPAPRAFPAKAAA